MFLCNIKYILYLLVTIELRYIKLFLFFGVLKHGAVFTEINEYVLRHQATALEHRTGKRNASDAYAININAAWS